MRAPKDAIALLSVFSRADGVNEITFACQSGTRKMVLEVAAGPTLLQRMWEKLDETMNYLMDPSTSPDMKAQFKIRARAQAEFLAMWMPPHFTTADMVAVEARRRFNARQEGTEEYDPEYETPGLGSKRYTPPPSVVPANLRGESNGKQSVTVKNVKELKDSDIPGIKQALDSKMFTAEQLAKSFGVSVDTIKAAVS